MERMVEMVAFVKVVEARSFSAAARLLGTSKSVISKRVSSLEQGLGVRLMSRSTRSMSLTESGAAYYEQCVRIVQAVEEAEQTLMRLQVQPRGVLKISTPNIFGRLYMAQLMRSFRERYPDVQIELNISDRMVDLVDEGFDLAIRVTAEPTPSAVAKKLAPVRGALCASPAYLAQHGTPQMPQDLLSHVCLVYYSPSTQPAWRFQLNGKPTTLDLSGHYRVNSLEMVVSMALAGMGVVQAPEYAVAGHLKAGRLVKVLTDSSAYPDKSLWLTYLPNRYLQPKVRAFIDHVAQYLGPDPDWAEIGALTQA
jgi:DNA-binding transcriptional LysR family regulator